MTLNRQYDGGSAELENNNCMLRSSHTASNNSSRGNEGNTSHSTFVEPQKNKYKMTVATSPLAHNRLKLTQKKVGQRSSFRVILKATQWANCHGWQSPANVK